MERVCRFLVETDKSAPLRKMKGSFQDRRQKEFCYNKETERDQ